MMRRPAALLLGALAHVGTSASFENMNLQDYVISSTPGTHKAGTYNTKWSEYPDGGVSFCHSLLCPGRFS